MTPEPAMTPRDVATLSGLCYQSVLAEIRTGALRARRIRGRYLVTRESFEAWIAPGEPERVPVVREPRAPRAVGGVGSPARLRMLEGEAA